MDPTLPHCYTNFVITKIIFIFFLLITSPLFAENSLSDHNKKLTEIQQQLKSNKTKLAPKQKQKEQTQYKIGKLNREIKFNELKLNDTKKKNTKTSCPKRTPI